MEQRTAVCRRRFCRHSHASHHPPCCVSSTGIEMSVAGLFLPTSEPPSCGRRALDSTSAMKVEFCKVSHHKPFIFNRNWDNFHDNAKHSGRTTHIIVVPYVFPRMAEGWKSFYGSYCIFECWSFSV